VPAEYRELVEDFPRRLALADARRPLLVLLDALDQLAVPDPVLSLTWLPRTLPPHVKLIASLSERGAAQPWLQATRRLLPEDTFVPLGPLSLEQGKQLLDAWLQDARRTLRADQRDHILDRFASCPFPLYLRLAFEEARRWHSDDPPRMLGVDVHGILHDLFARLEQKSRHGQALVSKSLGYLAAARNGLTEGELLDVLSGDEVFFEEFMSRAHHEPPGRRLPVVVWSRLYFDLEPYLTERRADNTSLLSFYHHQVAEVTAARYLAGQARPAAHERLAHYFASQPHRFSGPLRIDVPNYRKMAELPHQQTAGRRWDDLESI
jgi:hypothetical protein